MGQWGDGVMGQWGNGQWAMGNGATGQWGDRAMAGSQQLTRRVRNGFELTGERYLGKQQEGLRDTAVM
jgi:hypothetical protein